MLGLFKKKRELDAIRNTKIDSMCSEFENTVKIYDNFGGYKEYGIVDKKLKFKFVSGQLPFDTKKKVFTIQCSKDGENFVTVEPYAMFDGKRMYVDAKTDGSFPFTLNKCVHLVDLIARTNAITDDGDTDFKYWRIGIDWESGFATWFSGDIGSPVVNRNEYTVTDNFISHLDID